MLNLITYSLLERIRVCYTTIGNLAKYTSKHKGVSFHKARKKWRAYVTIQGKSTHIGMYNTEEEAVKAREEFINKLGDWNDETRENSIERKRR